ncbi:MAG: hypothetical protein ABSB01_06945 [Streptosporangiaceae bacterium]
MAGAQRFAGALLLRALTDTPRRQLNLPRRTRGLTPACGFPGPAANKKQGWRLDPNKTRGPTRGYLPLEVSESNVPELLEQALARHEHALTVTINRHITVRV